jgi:predicted GIY-YIG superfamily endonuclease
MGWVYILRCADGSYYVGSTDDLERRVAQHQNGFGAVYTRRRLPVELLWAAEFSRIEDAFWFEKQVQGWSRRKREALMAGDLPALRSLASRSWESMREIGVFVCISHSGRRNLSAMFGCGLPNQSL